MNVPLLDLKAQYQSIKHEIDPAVERVIESQYFILGPDVKQLEDNIASYVGCKHAIGVSYGTDALLLTLMALGVGPGDGVILPTFSFFATAGVVSRLNAVPVFVDVDMISYNIQPDAIERAIEKSRSEGIIVKAIIPVHLFGQSADMDAIMAMAEKHQLHVVEDAAQAIGTQYSDGRRVGSIGKAGCFSFFPSKNLGCFGDGGVITTNDDALAYTINIMRNHGMDPKYYHKVIGGNFRLDALQAAVLNVKLPHLNDWSAGRQKNANFYNSLFMEAKLSERTGVTAFNEQNKVLLPASVYNNDHPFLHIYNQYSIRVEGRDGLVDHLRKNTIGCDVYYPVPFHKQECFRNIPSASWDFPNSDTAAATILALPVYPELTEEMQRYVVDTIAEYLK